MAGNTLFAGTEYSDFVWFGPNNGINTFSGYINTANSRLGIAPYAAGSDDTAGADAPFTSTSEIWIHEVIGFNIIASNVPFLKVYGNSVARVRLLAAGTLGLVVQTWNGTTWTTILTTANNLLGAGIPITIDLHLKLGNPGIVQLYINGVVAAADSTLNFTFSGVTGFEKVRLQNVYQFTFVHSEVIVADWNTIGSKVVSRIPNGAGNYSAWTGTYADINEANGGTIGTSQILSGTADQRQSWTSSAFPALAANEVIAAVGMGISANRDAGGPQSLNMFVRISTTDYDLVNETVNVAFTDIQRLWATSPATATTWTISEINGAQFGVRSRA